MNRIPRNPRRGQRAFTLLEMIIVVAMIGILASIALPNLVHHPRRANEAVLKTNLHTMRDVIDQHYGDKGHYPAALEDLVTEGYLRSIPTDPIMGDEEWDVIYEEFDDEFEPAETDLPEDGAPGIIDVRSRSEDLSLDGTPYNEW